MHNWIEYDFIENVFTRTENVRSEEIDQIRSLEPDQIRNCHVHILNYIALNAFISEIYEVKFNLNFISNLTFKYL